MNNEKVHNQLVKNEDWMTGVMTRPASILAVAAVYFLVVSMTLTLSPRLQAEVVNVSTPNLSVFSSDSKPYNLGYGEWTARWWQWGYSIPKNINPAYDNTGKNCAQGQSGSVWFLAGTYGHPVERVCTVPADKAILFPVLNSECSFAEFPKLKTLSELRMCAKTIQDQVTTLMASVDGVPILQLQQYRIQSPPFNFTLSHNNILGMPANTTTEAVADGNWVFLKPLSPGVHKIIFKGEVQQPASIVSSSSFAFPSGWDFRTIYDLKAKSTSP